MNYEDWHGRRQAEEELERIQKNHICAECEAELVITWDPEQGKRTLVCGKDRSHQGYLKQTGYTAAYDQGEAIPLYIANKIDQKRRKQMTEELGAERATALAPFQGVTSLTRAQATFILKACWPDAPEHAVLKAAILCRTYGLNPLMKHVYLLPFKETETGRVKWEAILGIGTTRLLASRRGPYAYTTGPRLMTREEQIEIRGSFDDKNLWAITIVRTPDGREAPGYGSWPEKTNPYGTNKGNTKENMAFIRSERNALDRLFPGEMPAGVEVGEPQYLEAETSQSLGEGTDPIEGEVEEGKENYTHSSDPTGPEAPHGVCPVHNKPLAKGEWGIYCKTRVDDEKGKKVWCKGVAPEQPPLPTE